MTKQPLSPNFFCVCVRGGGPSRTAFNQTRRLHPNEDQGKGQLCDEGAASFIDWFLLLFQGVGVGGGGVAKLHPPQSGR